jgi:type IV secretion system protein VirB5
LTPAQVDSLSAADRQLLEASRRSKAMYQVMTREALGRSIRLIQQLSNAIGRADDQKAVLDLQARIQAESTMLMNETSSCR